jgi:excisionase family DNA binding protein
VSAGQFAAGLRDLRLALSPDEAAAVLGCSRDFFHEHVAPELRIVRRGRRRFVAVSELERWLDRSAARAYDGSDR